MSYNLFLDDIRNPADAYLHDERTTLFEKTHSCDWTVVKSYDEFVKCISLLGIPFRISFDHDLHFEHIRYYAEHTLNTGYIEYENFSNKTGKHCADYFVSILKERKLPLPQWFVHSANDIGRREIKKTLERYSYDQKNFL